MEYQSLRDAAQQGSIDALYASIREDAKVLDSIDEIPFIETPLHYAAFAGHTRFAMEIVRLKPSFAKKLNQHGFTPVHVALQNNHDQVVLQLIDVDENLVRVQGREGVTPLHYVAETGNLHLLSEFLKVCPKAIEDVTIRKETVLHIALKNNMLDAAELVLGWLQRAWTKDAASWERTLLNQQDEDGNNALHIAVSKNLTKIVRILLKFRRRLFGDNIIDINAKNSEGFTAFDMLQGDNEQMKKILCNARWFNIMYCSRVKSHANYFKSPVSIDERLYISLLRWTTSISNEMRNALLVVAALLVTMSFQTAISPPGGVWQDNYIPMTNTSNRAAPNNASGEYLQHAHYAGTAVMGSTFFEVLKSLNSMSFFVQVYMIQILLPTGFRMIFCIPLYSLSLCFIASLSITSPNRVPAGLLWIWNNFSSFWFCSSFLLITVFELIGRFRGYRLAEAFLPRK